MPRRWAVAHRTRRPKWRTPRRRASFSCWSRAPLAPTAKAAYLLPRTRGSTCVRAEDERAGKCAACRCGTRYVGVSVPVMSGHAVLLGFDARCVSRTTTTRCRR
eukprot:1339957-Prymnesium_polylepis.1